MDSNARVKEVFELNSQPSQYNHPFIKIMYNLFAIFLLGKNFDSIDGNYFTSVIMFTLPMLLEYTAFIPNIKLKKILKNLHCAVLLTICTICTIGWFDILYIKIINSIPYIIVRNNYVFLGGVTFPARWLWIGIFISFAFTCIDTFSSWTKAEERVNKPPVIIK